MFKAQINFKKNINTVYYISTPKSSIIYWTCSMYLPNLFFLMWMYGCNTKKKM